jgi:hypothetical protein
MVYRTRNEEKAILRARYKNLPQVTDALHDFLPFSSPH